MQKSMKAIVTNVYGAADVLTYQEVEVPVIEDDEILVQVHACSVNPVDWKVRRGDMKLAIGRKPPKILGGDYAGTVIETGKKIQGYQKGDAVWGALNAFKGGAYAEFLKTKPDGIGLKPENLNFIEASSVPIAGLTAYQALVYKGGLKAGDHIIINGCSGGVGLAGLQIAKTLGGHVTGVCSTGNIELIKKMGADETIDYTKEEVIEGKEMYDIFFDTVGNISFSKAKTSLKPGGVYVTTVPSIKAMLLSLIVNITGSRKIKIVILKPNTRDLNTLREMVENGKFVPVIEKVFPLDQVREAHLLSETNRVVGKLVLNLN